MTAGLWFMNAELRDRPALRSTVRWFEVGERAASWTDGCRWCRAGYGTLHRPHCFLRYGPNRTVTP